jgi:hypothetical protein
MNFRLIISIIGFGSLSLFATGCSSGSTPAASIGSATLDATKPSTGVAAVSSAVATAGTSMGSSGISTAFLGGGPVFHPDDISQDCSIHAAPERSGTPLTSADQDYPGKFIYCKMAYNTGDPESVQGAMSEVKSISCMLENDGLLWDGASHSYTVTTDTSCWTQQQLTNMGGGGTMTITATASMPASFNTYYARGISMSVPGIGIVQIATTISANKVEFVASEDLSANNKFDSFAGFSRLCGGRNQV